MVDRNAPTTRIVGDGFHDDALAVEYTIADETGRILESSSLRSAATDTPDAIPHDVLASMQAAAKFIAGRVAASR